MADYPNFAGEAQFKDTASVPTPPANNLAVYSDGGVLKTKNSSGAVTTLGASNMVGATSSAAGTAGLVPQPAAGKEAEYLRGDATFQPATAEWVPTTKKVKSGDLNCYDPSHSVGNKGGLNGFITWSYVYIPKTKSYSNVGIRVTTAVNPSKCKVGLYSVNTSGDPDVLQFETGEIDTATTGVKTISITAVTISAGWYYAALRPNASIAWFGTEPFFMAKILRGVGTNSAFTRLDSSTTTYANALPNPWSGSINEGSIWNPIVDVY